MSQSILDSILDHLRTGGTVQLFLDYDGTLVPIAPTPEEAKPDPGLLELLSRLVRQPHLQVMILSGRPLDWLRTVLPVPGLALAGIYGVEMHSEAHPELARCDADWIRPKIEQIKTQWQALVKGRRGFLVEDKGLSVALHARLADPAEGDLILSEAEKYARSRVDDEHFRILGGYRFLEIAPRLAHKGQTVAWLLEQQILPGALPVYFGDDDKDEEAFDVVRDHGGIPIVVGEPRGPTRALARLESPAKVREWLELFMRVGSAIPR